jgi:SAM-dependent methyltransferase
MWCPCHCWQAAKPEGSRGRLDGVPETLEDVLAEVREQLLDPTALVRAVAGGRRRGGDPAWRRAELRPVALKSGPHLQVVTYDEHQAYTRNLPYDDGLSAELDRLLGEPFGNWHLETATETVQLRVTKKGQAQVHRAPAVRVSPLAAAGGQTAHDRTAHDRTAHDRAKHRLLDPGDPLFDVLGGGAAKRRQVEAFLRALDPLLDDAGVAAGDPASVHVVDLGCGNAYLTFAAYRFLTAGRGLPARVVGVDVKAQARQRNTELAARLGWNEDVEFREGTILDAPVEGADVVLALHACDTATDEALARAVRWQAPLVLASPCCHHDVQRQLRAQAAPNPYALLTRHGILRERFGDVLTDALRAALLRLVGYRVDVVEFVGGEHTPRNLLLRAVRTGAAPTPEQVREYRELTGAWNLGPHLAALLEPELAGVLG